MPSGRAHRSLAVATSPLLVLGAWTLAGFPLIDQVWLDIGMVTLGYLVNPMLLSPDMDLPESSPSNAYGPLEFLWWPYQALIHRGPLSHLPPLSAVLRLMYLWLALFLAACFGAFVIDLIWCGLFGSALFPFCPEEWVGYWLLVWASPWAWRFLWGVCLGDAVHWIADKAYSYMAK